MVESGLIVVVPRKNIFIRLYGNLKEFIVGNPHPELGSCIQILYVFYYLISFLLIVPVCFVYDAQKKLYRIKKCNGFQRIICFGVQILLSFSIFQRIAMKIQILWENKNDIVRYFDLANETTLNIFLYWHFYIHWFCTSYIDKFAEMIQTSDLMRFNKTSAWKLKIFPLVFTPMVVFLAVSWNRTVHGIDWTSWEGLVETGATNARQLLWMSPDEEVGWALAIAAVASRFFNTFLHHSMLDCFYKIYLVPMLFITKDFFNAILTQDIPIEEVLELYAEYKRLITTCNRLLSMYLMYTFSVIVSWNSVHLFDTFNYPDYIWRINMYIYNFDNFFGPWLSAKTLLESKKLRKWLWMDDRHLKIEKRKLTLILHDMVPWIPRKGIKAGNFVVSAEFIGSVYGTMCSYCMLVSLS